MTFMAADPHFQISKHRNNPEGVQVSCGECHIPTDNLFLETYTRLTLAARDLFAPVENLTDPGKNIVHKWSGFYQSASASAQRLEDRAIAAFGKSADWSALLPYIEEHGTLPMTYNSRPEAQAFLQDWQRITAWARKYNLVPDPLNLSASSRVKT